MSESRKHERVPCRLRCRCESDHLTVFARVGNLSEGGLFLRTSTPLERGTTASLWLSATDQVLVGRVRWVRVEGQGGAPGMGLSFEGLGEEGRAAIRQILEVEQTN